MMFLITQPPHARNFTFWPTSPPTFRSTLDKYSTELKSVSRCLFDAIAKNLGLNPEVLCGIFKDHQRMRMNYYPPCPKANQVLGISPHTDAGGLTLLLQVRDVQGLQIKRRGKWLPVEPLDVNIGDALEKDGIIMFMLSHYIVGTELGSSKEEPSHSPPGDVSGWVFESFRLGSLSPPTTMAFVFPLPLMFSGGRLPSGA
ncbi:hypothetical protein J5N97_029789 [Dioscorea zingiberensis]|uniref:Fe2OG dioxygenase domain-containing protein n=1 Tax=Dioscorea zingiberensis TaxID=325984 RepID=A0A9D5BWS3_9LILI|nr:hypothetical protein J5N97_029789 [Dioscorea zingiberensis]